MGREEFKGRGTSSVLWNGRLTHGVGGSAPPTVSLVLATSSIQRNNQ